MQSDGGLLTSVLVAGALCLHHGPALPAAAEPESSKYYIGKLSLLKRL